MGELTLVETLRGLATALIVARQGVTPEAAASLPKCDPVTVADALETAADRIAQLEEALRRITSSDTEIGCWSSDPAKNCRFIARAALNKAQGVTRAMTC